MCCCLCMRFGECVSVVVLAIALTASVVCGLVPGRVCDRHACMCHAIGDRVLAAIVELVLA